MQNFLATSPLHAGDWNFNLRPLHLSHQQRYLHFLHVSFQFLTMGKDGFLTPKAIANRIKAKGLLKLKFYCQVCQKQCRDENGFKCHTMSESHQRQMLLVAENPGRYMHSFSDQFKNDFISLLSRRHGTKRVFANTVYQEYISDRHHLHMNATRWNTLSEFVKYLGREGICHVDETERGWYIAWIDNSPKALAKQVRNGRTRLHIRCYWQLNVFRLLFKRWRECNGMKRKESRKC